MHRNDSLEEREVDVRIRILLRIIEERAGVLQMSSKQIGNLLGLGEAHVLRLFNAEVGRSLRSHTREVRMARAAELLRDCSIPIKIIASSCGYTIVCNFYRDFKIVYGISPMQMRLVKMNLTIRELRSHNCGSGRLSNLSETVDADKGASLQIHIH
jgi:transcriptional regulator GlxA family with amidase domain